MSERITTEARLVDLERKFFRLTMWLKKRSEQSCHNCGGQNEHDRCDNEPRVEDFADLYAALIGPKVEDQRGR